MQGPHPLQLCSLLSVVGKLEKGPFPLPRLPLPADPLRAGAAVPPPTPRCPEGARAAWVLAHSLLSGLPHPQLLRSGFLHPSRLLLPFSLLLQGHARKVRSGPLLPSSDTSLGGHLHQGARTLSPFQTPDSAPGCLPGVSTSDSQRRQKSTWPGPARGGVPKPCLWQPDICKSSPPPPPPCPIHHKSSAPPCS